MISYRIPYLPPTANDREALARSNKFSSAKSKKDNTEKCALFTPKNMQKGKVYATIVFQVSNFNRDSDNLQGALKYVFDAMQGKIIASDNLNHLVYLPFFEKVKKCEEGIDIQIFNDYSECMSQVIENLNNIKYW